MVTVFLGVPALSFDLPDDHAPAVSALANVGLVPPLRLISSDHPVVGDAEGDQSRISA